jgi:tRNA-(ms[2]io[6]A)-hydroxylase
MIAPILHCKTPDLWIQKALHSLDILLIDHAHCEKKAALTAMSIIARYDEHPDLMQQMSKLAREELRHFEQVLSLLKKRSIPFSNIPAARYAQGLFKHARNHEPAKLIDTMIIGAFVEARSCERFSALIPHLDKELSEFYSTLLASEARHYELYLNFAKQFSIDDISERLLFFGEVEKTLIETADELFRFHSGI